MVVIKDIRDDDDSGEGGEEPELIPLRTDYQKTWTQGVQISYNAFPFDLGFAITYHKVQGQTMGKVILFLHKRTTKQLAPLQWESLYVAYTRVKCGDDIRVCYFGSDTSSSRAGLSHLKQLKRPKLYDVWQKAYTKRGKWTDVSLRRQAEAERNKLQHKLRYVTSISEVSLKKLKSWADILDVNVLYQPGTKRKNKAQYVEAITPVWVGVNGGALSSNNNSALKAMKKQNGLKSKSKIDVTGNNDGKTSKRCKSQERETTNRKVTETNNLIQQTDNSISSRRRVYCKPPKLSKENHQNSIRLSMNLRAIFGKLDKKRNAKRVMKRTTYCVCVPYVGQISQWSVYALATPGEFLCDSVLYFCASYFCQDHNCKAFVIDPILGLESEVLLRNGVRDGFLERLHVRRQTLVFPINAPLNVHWMVVFVWLNDDGKLEVQCRNSMRAFSSHTTRCCERVREYITRLYNQRGSVPGLFPGFQTSVPVTWTEQTPNVYACGLHVLSHIYLASKRLQHTHTFDNGFVEDLRKYCLQLLYQFRCGRRTTRMTMIDLAVDNPRFNLLSS